jgi:hypothetical protein
MFNLLHNNFNLLKGGQYLVEVEVADIWSLRCFQWGSCHWIHRFLCSILSIIVCLFVIVLSVLLWFTSSDYLFGIFLSLCCLSFFDLHLLITPLVSFCHCIVCPSLIYVFWLPLWYLFVIVLSVLLWFTSSDYPFGTLYLQHFHYTTPWFKIVKVKVKVLDWYLRVNSTLVLLWKWNT